MLRSTKNSSVVMTLEFLFYLDFITHYKGDVYKRQAGSENAAHRLPPFGRPQDGSLRWRAAAAGGACRWQGLSMEMCIRDRCRAVMIWYTVTCEAMPGIRVAMVNRLRISLLPGNLNRLDVYKRQAWQRATAGLWAWPGMPRILPTLWMLSLIHISHAARRFPSENTSGY